MMKMATGEGSPLRQGAGTGSRLVFGGYRGLRRRNSRSILFPEGFRVYWYMSILMFFAYFSVSQKRNIKRSPKGMKPAGELFLERKQSRRLGVYVREATRQGGAPTPWACPLPCGPLVAPLTDFFRLYMSIYPKNIKDNNRSRVLPPQASVATKNLSGARYGTLPEGDPSPVAIFIIPVLSTMRRE